MRDPDDYLSIVEKNAKRAEETSAQRHPRRLKSLIEQLESAINYGLKVCTYEWQYDRYAPDLFSGEEMDIYLREAEVAINDLTTNKDKKFIFFRDPSFTRVINIKVI